MANTNPARGMRDFLPADIRKRNYVIGVIKEVYEKYGFEPLETPSVENLDTLTNKYGEEGNQLMFKILKRGEKLQQELEEGKIKNENELTDLALRYDLTVPLARVVANYKNDLPKFFKRYQIQPVWRADRPARGRFREFFQCDVDAIGSSSMIVEAELCAAVSEILGKLGFNDFEIRVNSRKALTGILDAANISIDSQADALVALDKFDKIGREGVKKEFIQRGINNESGGKLLSIFEISQKLAELKKDQEKKLDFLRSVSELSKKDAGKKSVSEIYMGRKVNQALSAERIEEKRGLDDFEELELSFSNIFTITEVSKFIGENKIGREGIDEINTIIKLNEDKSNIKFDPSLARGLSYYTGAIFEVVLTNGDFSGSIAGGGRYDSLIGMFGKEQIPAVGFSLGLERILLIMEERGMFPDDLTANSADVMITLWNEDSASESLKLAAELRATGLRVLVYPEADKLGKQFKYADSLNIPYVCILGENELAENKVAVKNLKTGEQETISRDEITIKLSK